MQLSRLLGLSQDKILPMRLVAILYLANVLLASLFGGKGL